jgi:hypothetical protein
VIPGFATVADARPVMAKLKEQMGYDCWVKASQK